MSGVDVTQPQPLSDPQQLVARTDHDGDVTEMIARAIRRAQIGNLSNSALADEIVNRSWEGCAAEAQAALSALPDTAALMADNARLREALDMAAFRMQLLVDRMPQDEDGKTAKALSQGYVDQARTALKGTGHE